jgi:hypothetical protein
MTLSLLGAAAVGQHVYFGIDPAWNVKIGTSLSAARRGGELKIRLLISVLGGDAEEHVIHKMFRRYRTGGEWFEPADQLLLYMMDLIVSGDARVECGSAMDAIRAISEIHQRRYGGPAWDDAA